MSVLSHGRRRALTLASATLLALPLTAALGGTAYAAPPAASAEHGNSEAAHDNDNGNGNSDAAHGNSDAAHGNGNGHSEGAPGHSDGSSSSQSEGNGSTPHETKTDPQPASNADYSGNGANVHGPYDSTRDGSPSGNGNGNGEAKGKPCAGCVGKADNKNPKGQQPGGSDHNAGYECDRNHGIGRTNPAHTGCRTTPVVNPVPDCDGDFDGSLPTDAECQGGGGNPVPDCDGDFDGSLPTDAECQGGGGNPVPDCDGDFDGSLPTDAECVSGPQPPGTDVEGTKTTRKPPTVLGERTTRPLPSVLPFTGSHVDEVLVTGVLLLLMGTAAVLLGRRREV